MQIVSSSVYLSHPGVLGLAKVLMLPEPKRTGLDMQNLLKAAEQKYNGKFSVEETGNG